MATTILGRNFLVIIAQNVGKAGRLGNPGDSTTRCTVQLGVLFVDVKVEDRKGRIGPRSETGPGISLLLRTCSCALPVRFLDQPKTSHDHFASRKSLAREVNPAEGCSSQGNKQHQYLAHATGTYFPSTRESSKPSLLPTINLSRAVT